MELIFPPDELQILTAADSLLARAGLAALLTESGCAVLAQTDGAALNREVESRQPDILVVDMGWHSQAMRLKLEQLTSDLPVLALVAADEADEALLLLVQALNGFSYYALLLRDSAPAVIVAALGALAGGLTVIDPSLSRLMRAPSQPLPAALPSPLTRRENEVLQLLAQGLTNKAIALMLGITQHTVKFHVNAIMGKLDAQSRTEAVVRATQRGMIVL